jgi:Plasmid pRiA4b ORF-3-like protein
MSETHPPVVYQLKIVLLGIRPMIWRRIKLSSDSTIADLHDIIQIVMGWKEEHLHQFLIHGVHVNQVVSKRFVKKQQMRWSKKGAHLLLQVRNLVINQELRQRINSWYGNLTPTPEAS